MIGPQFVTRAELEDFGRKLLQTILGASSTIIETSGEPGIESFVDLADTPDDYTSHGNDVLRVKSTEDQLEFATITGTANQISVAHDATHVTLAAVPQFILSDGSAAPYLRLVNASDTERDPVVQWSLGATPAIKWTMGVDDSDADKFKISAGSALGTDDRIVITADPFIGIFTSSPQAPLHFISTRTPDNPDVIFEDPVEHMALSIGLKNYGRTWYLVSDNSPDCFGIQNGTDGHYPFVIDEDNNIKLFCDTGTWGGNGTTEPLGSTVAKCIAIKRDSVWPTASYNDEIIYLGGFLINCNWVYPALGVLTFSSHENFTSKTYISGSFIFINESVNLMQDRGLTIQGGEYATELIALKQSTVAHGITNQTETDTFGTFCVNTSGYGGIEMNGFTAGRVAIGLYSFYTITDTTFDTDKVAHLTMYSAKKSGSNYGDCGATDDIFALRPRIGSAWTTVWMANAQGDSWQRGKLTVDAAVSEQTFTLGGDGTADDSLTYWDGDFYLIGNGGFYAGIYISYIQCWDDNNPYFLFRETAHGHEACVEIYNEKFEAVFNSKTIWEADNATGKVTFPYPIVSSVINGTAPFEIISTTMVSNLNAERWSNHAMPALEAGKFLYNDGAALSWRTVAGGLALLSSLEDVSFPSAGPEIGDILIYESPGWTCGRLYLDELADVDITSPADGDVLTFDAISGTWGPAPCAGGSGGGASEFLDLTDVPASYSGYAGLCVRVNATQTGLEFTNPKLDDLAVPDDNTDLDFSITKHGLISKAPNDKGKFMRGDAAWSYLNDEYNIRIKGRYYSAAASQPTIGAGNWGADYIRAIPFVVTRPTTFDRIGIGVTANAGAGRYMRLGIYANDESTVYGYPGALVLDSGAIEVTSNTFWEAVINQTLQPGLYWLALLPSYTSLTLRIMNAGYGGNQIMGAPDGSTAYGQYYTASYAYGALPATYPAGADVSSGTTCPYIVLRVA